MRKTIMIKTVCVEIMMLEQLQPQSNNWTKQFFFTPHQIPGIPWKVADNKLLSHT